MSVIKTVTFYTRLGRDTWYSVGRYTGQNRQQERYHGPVGQTQRRTGRHRRVAGRQPRHDGLPLPALPERDQVRRQAGRARRRRWRSSSTKASSRTSSRPAPTRWRRRTCRSCRTLHGWKYGFNSPFKAEVYFVSTRMFTDRKWGTKNPHHAARPGVRPGAAAGLRHRSPSRCRTRPRSSARSSAPTAASRVEEIGDQLRDLIVARFADVLGESKIPVLDLASNYDELGKFIAGRIQSDFDTFGLQVQGRNSSATSESSTCPKNSRERNRPTRGS